MGISFGSNNMALGIDIGTSAVKIVQLKKNPSGMPELVNYGYRPLPPEAMADGSVSDPATVAEVIKELKKERGFKSASIYASISGQNVIMRFTKLPVMDPAELEQTVKIEAEQYVPYSIDEVSITHAVLKTVEEEEEGGGKYKILLVVAQKELVTSYTEVIKSAIGKCEVVDVDTIAAINALENSFMMTAESQEGGEVVAIIDSGARTTNISVLKSGILEFTRNIPIAGNNITESLKDTLKQEFDQAESIKIQEGSIGDGGGSEISEVIQGTVDELASEIRRSFDYFKAQSREPMIHKIILSGGSANLNGFSTYLMNELGVDVQVGNPLEGIAVNVPDADDLYNNLQQFTVAIGLALRGVTEA